MQKKAIESVNCCECGAAVGYVFKNAAAPQTQAQADVYCFLCAHNVADILIALGISPNSEWSPNGLYAAYPMEEAERARKLVIELRNATRRFKQERI